MTKPAELEEGGHDLEARAAFEALDLGQEDEEEDEASSSEEEPEMVDIELAGLDIEDYESYEHDDDGAAPVRSACRCGVRDTLSQDLGMSQSAATAYARNYVHISVPDVTWEDIGDLRSADVHALFHPPPGAPSTANPVQVKVQYHGRQRYHFTEYYYMCFINDKLAWSTRAVYGDSSDSEDEQSRREQQYESRFELRRETVQAIAENFAPWRALRPTDKGDENAQDSTQPMTDREFEKGVFKVLFSGVAVDYSKSAHGLFVSIHDDDFEYFEKHFDNL